MPDAVQVLSQTSVFVDLLTDYTGVLVIDDVEIETIDLGEIDSSAVEPGQQVDIPPATVYEPGNATLTYTPTEGAPIETFETGLHRRAADLLAGRGRPVAAPACTPGRSTSSDTHIEQGVSSAELAGLEQLLETRPRRGSGSRAVRPS